MNIKLNTFNPRVVNQCVKVLSTLQVHWKCFATFEIRKSHPDTGSRLLILCSLPSPFIGGVGASGRLRRVKSLIAKPQFQRHSWAKAFSEKLLVHCDFIVSVIIRVCSNTCFLPSSTETCLLLYRIISTKQCHIHLVWIISCASEGFWRKEILQVCNINWNSSTRKTILWFFGTLPVWLKVYVEFYGGHCTVLGKRTYTNCACRS